MIKAHPSLRETGKWSPAQRRSETLRAAKTLLRRGVAARQVVALRATSCLRIDPYCIASEGGG